MYTVVHIYNMYYITQYIINYKVYLTPPATPIETNYRSGYRRLDGLIGLVGGEWGSLPSECSTSLFLFFRLKKVLRKHRRCVRATGKRVTPMPKAFPLVISRAQACGVYFSIGSLENRSNYSSWDCFHHRLWEIILLTATNFNRVTWRLDRCKAMSENAWKGREGWKGWKGSDAVSESEWAALSERCFCSRMNSSIAERSFHWRTRTCSVN